MRRWRANNPERDLANRIRRRARVNANPEAKEAKLQKARLRDRARYASRRERLKADPIKYAKVREQDRLRMRRLRGVPKARPFGARLFPQFKVTVDWRPFMTAKRST